MSVASLGSIVGSAAGSPLAQSAGSDLAQAALDVANQQRKIVSAQRAGRAAGIAEADGEDLQISDRDGDGRQPWVLRHQVRDITAERHPSVACGQPQRDVDTPCGQLIDLSG